MKCNESCISKMFTPIHWKIELPKSDFEIARMQFEMTRYYQLRETLNDESQCFKIIENEWTAIQNSTDLETIQQFMYDTQMFDSVCNIDHYSTIRQNNESDVDFDTINFLAKIFEEKQYIAIWESKCHLMMDKDNLPHDWQMQTRAETIRMNVKAKKCDFNLGILIHQTTEGIVFENTANSARFLLPNTLPDYTTVNYLCGNSCVLCYDNGKKIYLQRCKFELTTNDTLVLRVTHKIEIDKKLMQICRDEFSNPPGAE